MNRPLLCCLVLALTSAVAKAQGTCPGDPFMQELGAGTPGTSGVPRLEIGGASIVGLPLTVSVRGTLPGAQGLLLIGRRVEPVPLPRFAATLYPNGPERIIPFVIDESGYARLATFDPLGPEFCGVRLVIQAAIVDEGAIGGLAFTSGQSLLFGPASAAAPRLDEPESPTTINNVVLHGSGVRAHGSVRIEGGTKVVNAKLEADGRFSATVPIGSNTRSKLFVREMFKGDVVGPATTVEVVHDASAPVVTIEFPDDGTVFSTETINVAGTISDKLSGFMGLEVSVNGQPATVNVGIGTNGSFDLAALDLGSGGPVAIDVVAQDAAGNVATVSHTVVFQPPSGAVLEVVSGDDQVGTVGTELGDPLVVRARSSDGSALPGQPVTFQVAKSDGVLALASDGAGSQKRTLVTDLQGEARVYWRQGSDAGMGNNRVRATSTLLEGTGFFCASAAPDVDAIKVNVGTGELQVVQAGARAAEPLVAWVNDGQNPLAGVSVTFEVVQGTGLLEPPGGGERSSSVTVPTDLTGHARAHFVAADTAEAARVEARVDGSSGLPASFQIRSVVPDQLGTRLSGFVRDNSLEGLGGATVRLRFADGAEVQTSTDIAGHFGFTSLQTSGPGLVIVEGSTAVTRGGEPIDPTEVVFPQLAQEAFVVSAAGNVLPRPILLPPLDPETFVLYDGTRDVELTVPEIEGLAVSVPRGTVVTKPDGSIVSTSNPIELSISPVHVDDIPMPLPDGARAPFAWTLQPGGTTFDPPVGITLPNMAGLPPGALAYILVFDHHTNRFEIVAPGQVSADGALIASNPGTGIAEAGWGGFCPPYPATGTVSGPAAPSPGDCSVENLLAKKALLTLVIRGMQLVEPPAYGADHLQHFLDGVGTPLSYGEGDAAVRDIKAHPGFICEHEKIVDELCQKIFSAGGPVSDYSTSTDTIVFYDITSPCGAVDRCFGVKQPAWAFGRIDPASVLIHDVTVDSENNTFSAVATYQMVEHYTFDGDPCEGSAFDAAAQVLEDCNFAQPFDINVAFDVPIEDRPLSCSGSIASEGLNDGGPTNTTLPYVQANTLLNIGGQSAIGEEDGSFEIPNVLADGSIVRVTAVREIAGVTWTGQSEYFQVVDGGSVEVEPFPLVPFALPETVEILATANPPTLTSIGQTATVDTLAALSDGSAIPVAGFSNGVAYQSSQPNIISVDADGVATAQSAGPAFITVTKDGAASTVKIVVAPGDPLTTLQGVVVDAALQPVDGATVTTTGGFETTSQPDGTFQIVGHTTARNPVRVNAGSGDAFGFILELPLAVGGVTEAGTLVIDVDTDGDRLPDWYEINIFNTDRLVADTDGDGLSDGREVLQLGTSPSRADTDGDGFDDSLEATVGSNPLSFDPGTTLTGEVELPGGIPASGAQMNVLGIPSALFSATADGLGAFTFSNPWPAGVSPVTLRGTLSVEGQGFFSGLSEPTPTVPRGTTDMKTLVLTSDVGGPLYPGRMYPAGSGPRSIATSDLNGDGAEDLAVANNDSNDVSILLGQGDGTFLAQQRFTAGSDPRSVAISDLNGDAFPDLAIANFSSDDVSILLGQGDGTFFPQQRFSAGTRPISVAISDLNGDGAEDLSVANNGSDDISILLGRGDGAFFAQQNFSAGTRPMSVATSNLNGDLIPDLAVANNGSDDISIFLGLGDGTFAVQQRYSAAGGPSSIAVSDLNSDGANDLAVANGRSDDVSILLGQGDGTFDSQQRFPAGIAPRSVAISDLNGDGTGDLVVANNDIHSDDDLSIRFGRGDGTFSAQQRISAGVDLWSVAIADFNGDGGGDLAIADDRSDDVSILLGQGDGTFFTQQRFSAARTPWSIAISDLNSDGAKDLAVTSISSDCISIFLGQGDGTFFAEQCYSAGLQPWSVAISDFNGDGFEDLAVANERSHDVSILLGQGNGSFLAQQRFSAGASPRSVAVADLNGDGAQDLAVANEGSHDVSVLLGQGDGTFASQQRFSSGAHPWSVAISDFNGDRAGDLVLANWGSNDVSILLGRGDGSFLAQQRFSAGTRPVSVAISDFNGDGAEDVAASSAGSDAVSILLGLGDGTLLAPQSYYAGAAPTSVAISDLDGDGIPDLAVANNDVSVLLGHGDGTFFPEQRFSAGAGARSLAISDLNGDGSPDLAVADSGFISVRVLLRR